MDSRNVKAWGVLAALILAFPVVAWLAPGPSSSGMERASERIGWSDPVEADPLAHDVYTRVNDERSARGLPPLEWHDGLADIARRWSEEMIGDTYEHSPAGFRAHPDFVGTGENIAMGYLDAGGLHVGWMESDGHRENVLDPSYTAIGIGIVCRNDGAMWATQVLGVPHGALPTPDRGATSVEPIERRDPGPECPAPFGRDLIFDRRHPDP